MTSSTFLSHHGACVLAVRLFISPMGTGGCSVAARYHAAVSFRPQLTFFLHFETCHLRVLFLNAVSPQSQMRRRDTSFLPAFPQICVVGCK